MRDMVLRERTATFLFLFLLVIGGYCHAAGGVFGGGTGTGVNPYIVEDAYDLQAMGQDDAHLSAYYALEGDLDAAATSSWNEDTGNPGSYLGFLPVAYDTVPDVESDMATLGFQGPKFTGGFDGRGHAIVNLFINRPGENYVGLFGFVDGSTGVDCGTIRRLTIASGNVAGKQNVGTIAGVVLHGEMVNCHVACVVTGAGYVGGLAGESLSTLVARCSFSGNLSNTGSYSYYGGVAGYLSGEARLCFSSGIVNGPSYTGGIAGTVAGVVSQCFSTSEVQGYSISGGVAGSVSETGMVSDCYATGHVSGSNGDLGGIAGRVYGGVARCYETGTISATFGRRGAIAGYLHYGSITDSFFNSDTIALDITGKTDGLSVVADSYGRSGVVLMTQANYTTAHSGQAWDFERVWAVDEGVSLPYFQALGAQGELIDAEDGGPEEGEGEEQECSTYPCYRNLFIGQLALCEEFDELAGISPFPEELSDPDVFQQWIVLAAYVLGTPSSRWHDAAVEAYRHNLAVIRALGAPAHLMQVVEGVAALCMMSASVRDALVAVFGFPSGFALDSLWVVENPWTSDMPLSCSGDYDGDSVLNIDEYWNVYHEAGISEDRFLAAVTNPNLEGSEHMPAVCPIGAMLLLSLFALVYAGKFRSTKNRHACRE